MSQSHTAHGETFTRAQALLLIWRHTHRDYKGTRTADGKRTLLVNRGGGTCLVELDALTDAEIADKLPLAVRMEQKRTQPVEQEPTQPNRLLIFSATGSKSWARPTLFDHMCNDGRTAIEPRLTLEDVRKRYPDAVCLPEEEAMRRYEQAFRKPAKPVTRERFDEMFKALPPCRWLDYGSTESFHLAELLAGNVAVILCRIDDQYFELHDLRTLSHDEIVKKCKPVDPTGGQS